MLTWVYTSSYASWLPAQFCDSSWLRSLMCAHHAIFKHMLQTVPVASPAGQANASTMQVQDRLQDRLACPEFVVALARFLWRISQLIEQLPQDSQLLVSPNGCCSSMLLRTSSIFLLRRHFPCCFCLSSTGCRPFSCPNNVLVSFMQSWANDCITVAWQSCA